MVYQIRRLSACDLEFKQAWSTKVLDYQNECLTLSTEGVVVDIGKDRFPVLIDGRIPCSKNRVDPYLVYKGSSDFLAILDEFDLPPPPGRARMLSGWGLSERLIGFLRGEPLYGISPQMIEVRVASCDPMRGTTFDTCYLQLLLRPPVGDSRTAHVFPFPDVMRMIQLLCSPGGFRLDLGSVAEHLVTSRECARVMQLCMLDLLDRYQISIDEELCVQLRQGYRDEVESQKYLGSVFAHPVEAMDPAILWVATCAVLMDPQIDPARLQPVAGRAYFGRLRREYDRLMVAHGLGPLFRLVRILEGGPILDAPGDKTYLARAREVLSALIIKHVLSDQTFNTFMPETVTDLT